MFLYLHLSIQPDFTVVFNWPCGSRITFDRITSLYISNSSMSWQSGNFSSHLRDAALPTEISVFQSFPLKLFYFVYAFEYQLDEKLKGNPPIFCISTTASRLHLPLPLFLLYYVAVQNRSGLVVSSPGRQQNSLQSQLGRGWFSTMG